MKRWNILSVYIPKKSILSQLVDLRGIDNFTGTPELPSDLKEALKKASEIVKQAMEDQRDIVIYGDYDVDGISSTAIVYKTLVDEFKYKNVKYFIPNRFEHGYGLSVTALDLAIKKLEVQKEALFITVDTGVTALEEIKYLKSLGYGVIVLDHHQKPEELPPADCLVWWDKVVAAVLAWFFCKSLGSKNPQTISLAALATITDMQQVLGLNRIIVKNGLKVLNQNPHLGISELVKFAGKSEGEITTYDLGWVIGPRLNASGRMVNADESLQLLIENDPTKLRELAGKLNELNSQRQDKTTEMFEIASGMDTENLPKIIFTESESYHEGIIGLVAAKLVQQFYRPAIVVSLSDEYGKGSVRSVKGFDVTEYLRKFSHLFESLGGHAMAAGFSIKKENLDKLKELILQTAPQSVDDKLLTPEINIDLEIPLEIVSLDLVNEIEKLKPFGLGNEDPLFLSRQVGVMEVSTMGKENNHLRIKLYKEGKYYKGVYFDGVKNAPELAVGSLVDVVYSLKKNYFNGNYSVDLMIKDLRPV